MTLWCISFWQTCLLYLIPKLTEADFFWSAVSSFVVTRFRGILYLVIIFYLYTCSTLIQNHLNSCSYSCGWIFDLAAGIISKYSKILFKCACHLQRTPNMIISNCRKRNNGYTDIHILSLQMFDHIFFSHFFQNISWESLRYLNCVSLDYRLQSPKHHIYLF